MNFLYIPHRTNGDLDGINAYLRAHDSTFPSGYISTTSTELEYPGDTPDNTLLHDDSIFTTKKIQNAYIGYHFIGWKLYLDSYTIKAQTVYGNMNDFPRCWSILGTNDNKSFTLVDKQNTQIFQTIGQKETFKAKYPNSFSSIYLVQTCENSQNTLHLRFSQIEFFGGYSNISSNIMMKLRRLFTCRPSKRIFHSNLVYILYLMK